MSIVVRRAKASDKAPLMDFIRKVWGGHDYIPFVWDEWLADRKSVLDVLEIDGKQIGMGRLRFLDDGVGWLEGARIHPNFRGRGLASVLGQELMNVGLEKGVTAFRLASNSRNAAAHRQVAKIGFKEKSRVSVYEPRSGTRFRAQRDVRQAKERELPEIEMMVRDSKEYRIGGGVYWDGFTATGLGPKVLASLVREGSVFRSDGAIAVARVRSEGGSGWRQVCFIAGRPDGAVKLVKHVFGKKEGVRTNWKLAFVPQGSPLIATIREMGLRRSWSLVLFEGGASKD